MERLSSDKIKKVLDHTKDFIVKILNEMETRLFVNEEIFEGHNQVFIQRGWICEEDLWRALGNTFKSIITPEKEEQFEFQLEKFYVKSAEIKATYQDYTGTPLELWIQLRSKYPHVAELAMAILTLPHSSVPVERIFSKMKDFKTFKRSRLTVENLEACLLVDQRFKDEFIITETIVSKRVNMWKGLKTKDTNVIRPNAIEIE